MDTRKRVKKSHKPCIKNNYSNMAFLFTMICFVSLLFVQVGYADDLLKPGDTTVKDTFGKDSSLMTWLLIGEIVTAIVAYVATKNVKVLFGVIVLSVFINIAFSVIT